MTNLWTSSAELKAIKQMEHHKPGLPWAGRLGGAPVRKRANPRVLQRLIDGRSLTTEIVRLLPACKPGAQRTALHMHAFVYQLVPKLFTDLYSCTESTASSHGEGSGKEAALSAVRLVLAGTNRTCSFKF